MKKYLMDRNIGYNFEKKKSSISRIKLDKLKLVYKASIMLNNLGDISKVDYDKIEDFDLMNMSFPCTDISNAGQQKGMKNEDGTPTRSGLYIYSIKAVRAKKPKYVMIENVKALIQKKFIEDFYSVISELEECGYNCYYPTKEDKKGVKPICLNSKDFGIPQNRERIFVIAIRKDIDTKAFEFPIGRDYGIRLKDVLEDQVNEKYYLSPEIQNKIFNWKAYQRPFENVLGENSTSPTITARGAGEYHSGMILVGDGLKDKTNLEDDRIICEQRSDEGLRFFKDNICGALRTIDSCGDKRVIENGAIRGRYNEEGKVEQKLELRNDGIINTLTTVEKDNVLLENKKEIRVRKLTPLECWRLQGFRDEMFYKVQELGISDTQLYKQAGNSITVNVLYYIFKNLFKEYIK
ncbi:DNA (cytosine-5-)-methyltransferase [uncultured Clostridium sp.]|uniref:DNA (cytosine-5-)-methyltransferase n=1 Tax=uncultured Clostridium sp. TaxID=59620 RepID=UPI00261653D7|nr:DNA (cytosine-5-)-methyltransferase [uncultured Clostridium sp.]